MQGLTRRWRADGCDSALVPTMGNLHDGHMALVRRARRAADRVLVSIFVNPAQFGPDEDYQRYPRTWAEDLQRLRQEKVDAIYAPTVRVMFPSGADSHTRVTVPYLDAVLCGRYRPGHFTGVATVVARLFALTQPTCAVFGQKDYQQWLVIRRMTADMAWPVRLIGQPTVRDADGLAISSRNAYLSAEERKRAPQLHRTLQDTAAALNGGQNDYASLQHKARQRLMRYGMRPEYVAVRKAADLHKPQADEKRLRVLAAAWLGNTRLIDNVTARYR